MSLREYRRKRRFDLTPEPAGRAAPRAQAARSLRYVIQKHQASHLHYDLRLEWNGVLLSWAVPKGPSLDPSVKRLAMRVEDHPLDYADFEGTIPEGEYGAGTVKIWDRGTYENLLAEEARPLTMAQAIDAGRLEFTLHGKKLRGAFALVRMNSQDRGKDNWLLI